MIDTIKFSIPYEKEVVRVLFNKVNLQGSVKQDTQGDVVHYKVVRGNLHIPSYSRDITLFIDILRERFYIEFSVPKMVFGHNIYLFYVEDDSLVKVIEKIYLDLKELAPNISHFDNWVVQRLDVCYAWKYESQQTAIQVMDVLKSYDYPRKKMHKQDTGILAVGRSYSPKFYLKQPEFLQHDFKAIRKTPYKDLDSLVAESEGVLRFEVTLRAQALKQKFPQHNRLSVHDISRDKIYSLLREFLSKYLRYAPPQIQDSAQALEQLNKCYKKSKATRLWLFREQYFGGNELNKTLVKAQYDRRTIWKNLKDLAEAGVGVVVEGMEEIEMDLDIPSALVVNKNNSVMYELPNAVAGQCT